MDSIKNKRDSYAERRKLFKNIWDTAVSMDDNKDPDVIKPKIIKTLRLSDMDCKGKNKKQRIKNLRTVCTRLLDFCDRQDADDEKMTTVRQDSKDDTSALVTHSTKKRRIKKKKKVQRVFSYVASRPAGEPVQDNYRLSFEEDGPITHRGTRPLRNTSPKLRRSILINQFLNERHNLKNTPPRPSGAQAVTEHKPVGDTLRKVVKKKNRKRKRPILTSEQPTKVITSQKKSVSGMKKIEVRNIFI